MMLLAGLLRSRRRVIAHMGAGAQDTGGLNATSPLGDELLWAVISGAHPGRDRVGGYQGQPEGGAALVTDAAEFNALHSPGWGGSGWYWPAPAVIAKEYTVGVRLSIVPPTADEITAGDQPKILAIPYHAAATWWPPGGWNLWLGPFNAAATSAQLRFGYAVSASTLRSSNGPTGLVLFDGNEHIYVARVRDEGTNGAVDWFRDGELIDSTSFNGAHVSPDLGDAPYLIAFNRHRLADGEGLRATMPAAAIWGKALSDGQIELLSTNPWDLAEISADPLVPPALHAWDDHVTAEAGEVTRIQPLANDSGAGLTIQSVTQPGGVAAGTEVAIVGGTGGTEVDITVDEEEEAGSFTFTYTVADHASEPDTATVHVEVTGISGPGEPDPGEPGEPGAFNDRPYQGRFYGCLDALGSGFGDTRLRRAGQNAVGFYFVASRTGKVIGWSQHRRVGVAGTTTQTRTARGNSAEGWAEEGPEVTGTFRLSDNSEGYNAGEGGTYRVMILPANPNTKMPIWGASPLAEKIWVPTRILRRDSVSNQDKTWGWPRFMWPKVRFDTPGNLVAGEGYAFVWDNISSNPGGDYVSMNSTRVFDSQQHEDPPPFVGASGSGWTPAAVDGGIMGKDWYPWTTIFENGALRHLRYGAHMVSFFWEDGLVTGNTGTGGGQRDASSGLIWREHTSSRHIRERFRPSFDGLVVDGVWFWAARKGSQSGNVVITLEQGPASDTSGNGTVLREVSISLNSLTNVGSGYSVFDDKVSWVFLPFDSIALSKGVIYNVRLGVSGSGSFWMGANQTTEHSNVGTSPVASSWDEHEATTLRSLECWRDSRGTMVTDNGGSSWSYNAVTGSRGIAPIALRCVV